MVLLPKNKIIKEYITSTKNRSQKSQKCNKNVMCPASPYVEHCEQYYARNLASLYAKQKTTWTYLSHR
jgi:hypothetical protein